MAQALRLFTSLRYDPALSTLSDEPLQNASRATGGPSPFYMLAYHRDRLVRAASHWGWESATLELEGQNMLERMEMALVQAVQDRVQSDVPQSPTAYKVKVIVDEAGYRWEMNPVPAVPPENLYPPRLCAPGEEAENHNGYPSKTPSWQVVVDSQGTESSELTHFKTTNRFMYDEARARANLSLQERKEVLLVNAADGTIMEGSLTTPYFWRDDRWVTPPVSAPYRKGQDSGGNDGTTRRWALEKGLAVEEAVQASTLKDGEECWLSNGVRGFMFGTIHLSI